ncbi:MAG: sulfotransferase [Acidimicrobiales bacterium]
MRDLIIQGMRRSGTTVLFDVFVRDPRFETYYEPLNDVPSSAALGGGSGLHQIDLFAAVRGVRAGLAAAPGAVDESLLNHGGPARPEVECREDMPGFVEEYVKRVLGAPGPKVTKFVRMGSKVHTLARLAPESVLAWPVRDPREVVRSHILGRGGRTSHRYPSADAVFTVASTRDPWSVRRLSEALIARDRLEFDAPLSDVERIVLVWADAVRTMMVDGPEGFGERSLMMRHEDFCADPAGVLTRLFEALGGSPDPDTVRWCQEVVREPTPWVHATDARWRTVFERTGAMDLVVDLGYFDPSG